MQLLREDLGGESVKENKKQSAAKVPGSFSKFSGKVYRGKKTKLRANLRLNTYDMYNRQTVNIHRTRKVTK